MLVNELEHQFLMDISFEPSVMGYHISFENGFIGLEPSVMGYHVRWE